MRGIAALVLAASVASCDEPKPSRLRIVDAMATHETGSTTLDWCRSDVPSACGERRLTPHVAGEPVTLMPGRYRFVLRDAAGRRLDDFVYGIGSAQSDLLVLYGFTGKDDAGVAARAARWLSGTGADNAHRFGIAHRMIDLTTGVHSDRADLRLIDLAVGTQPLIAKTGGGSTAPTAYGALSDPLPLERGARTVTIRFASSERPLAQVDVLERPGRRTVIGVDGIDRDRANTFVVSAPDRGAGADRDGDR